MNVKQMLDFSALMNRFSDQAAELRREEAALSSAAKADWQQKTQTLDTAASQLKTEFTETEERRKGWADHYTNQARQWLEELNDPLWHAVKSNCFLQCTSPRAQLTGKNETQLLVFLQERLFDMEKVLQKLKGSFIPPSMSATVGKVIPSYKRKLHCRLAQDYSDICCAADVLRGCGDIERSRAHAEAMKAQKQAAYTDSLQTSLRSSAQTCRQKRQELLQSVSASLEKLDASGLFRPTDPIHVGTWFRAAPVPGMALPSSLQQSEDGSQVSFPLYLPLPDRARFFLTDSETAMAPVFASWALDVLQANSGSQVYFADLVGLGSRYSLLSPLTAHGRVQIWSSEGEIRSGLAALSRRIAEHHTAGTAVSAPVFLFVETLERNIPPQDLTHFFSIAQNGAAAGVFVLFSMDVAVIPDRVPADRLHPNRVLADQLHHLEQVTIRTLYQNTLLLPGGAGIRLGPYRNPAARVQALAETETTRRSQSAVLPLGPRMPGKGEWQRKSSAKGIEIAVGDAPDGQPVLLRLNQTSPYGLIIGDVASGKSSLSHTICLQLMANYGPDEVRLAIADLRMGAEFNAYALANLPSVEAVVNDEDPDVMASFLRLYAAELQRRQKLFDQLEQISGALVHRYENYREVWETHGRPTEPLPRIVLLIDEFQSLFENGSVTAALLNELVRKGCAYGIHIIMASQRAVGDNARNSFTSNLKNYFTARFVLRCPQIAARSLLSDRCVDTGRENSGIAAAPTLPRGHAVFNTYMGEMESANQLVQCYYADSDTIPLVCRILSALNGKGSSVLLKRGAASPAPVLPPADCLLLGASACLHQDAVSMGGDVMLDDTHVGVRTGQCGQNLLLTGSDARMVRSAARSAALYLLSRHADAAVHVFGPPASPVLRELLAQNDPAFVFHTTEESIKEELTRQTEEGPLLRVNLFVEPDTLSCFAQGYSRMTPEGELLKQVLSHAALGQTVNLLYGKTFRSLRSQMAYAVEAAPIHLTAVGDAENLRAAMPETCRITPSEFDQPRDNAICAYYCNAETGKWGKVLLFAL